MDNTNMGGFSWGWVIFIVLILWFFVGGNNGFGFGNRFGNGFGFGAGLDTALIAGALGSAGCSRVSNCEVERQALINAAETNFRIIEENRKSTEQISSQLRAQYDAEQGEKIFDLKLNNVMQQNAYNLALSEKNATIERMTLANSINARFDTLSAQICKIQGEMLTKPSLSGVAAVCPNAGVINGLGINSLAGNYGYGYNNGCGCNGYNNGVLA